MAYRHVDLTLASGANDGTSWADAYQGVAGLATAGGTAGDIVFVKNSGTAAGTYTLVGPTTAAGYVNPTQYYAVLAATTNEGVNVVTADLVPGIATAGAGTTPAYDHADSPLIQTNSPNDITFTGSVYAYGLDIQSGDWIAPTSNYAVTLEECRVACSGVNNTAYLGAIGNVDEIQCFTLINSKLDNGGTSSSKITLRGHPRVRIQGGVIDSNHTTAVMTFEEFSGSCQIIGADLSIGGETTIIDVGNGDGGHVTLHRCKYPASHVLVGGTTPNRFKVESWGSEDSTGLTTGGSEQAMEIRTAEGAVDIETTAVRTGGADDGAAGAFSWALTPNASATVDGVQPLYSPDMRIVVEGDGTSKTVTVYVANDGAGSPDNNKTNNEVWLELFYPSATGISMHDRETTKMLLLGSPDAVTIDAVSTWAAPAASPQKLTQAISPDYTGIVLARVAYSHRNATPDTLYVDPVPEIA
jgi:hypothetical protein